MADLDSSEIEGLREEIVYLKNRIKFLEQQLCGEGGHRMKHLRSDVHKEKIPIFRRLDNEKIEKIEVKVWHDITDIYVCEKCGVLEHKLRKLPIGYSRMLR